MLKNSEIEWHDIRVDPDDLPGNGDPIIVTLESVDGSRLVWLDVVLQDDPSGDGYQFVTQQFDAYSGIFEKTPVWYPVIAWAYPPEAYSI
jgi:hypothetical protein